VDVQRLRLEERGAHLVAIPMLKRDKCQKLTIRQTQLLDLLVDDAPSNKEIAQAMGISEDTVKRHLQDTMNKVGCDSRTQLLLWTLRQRSEKQTAAILGAAVLPLATRITELERELAKARA
jgi:DNA-binding NarL/FixJ family response regulator